MAQGAKVDVCHIPPGNPDNAHTITISIDALETHLDHGDSIGACEAAQAPGASTTACICPRPGIWEVTNREGWMECSMLGFKRKLKAKSRNEGAIWILNDDCSTIFSESYEREREDVLMDRGRECLFFGFSPGEEEGAEVLFDAAYRVESEVLISGEFYLDMSGMGNDCEGYRPFEAKFIEPLSEEDYARLESKMKPKVETVHQLLNEYQEVIDNYLEKTQGGKAFGGRNDQQ